MRDDEIFVFISERGDDINENVDKLFSLRFFWKEDDSILYLNTHKEHFAWIL